MKKTDFLCDNHVHTSLCGHASGTMEEYIVSAISKGLKKINFLEHMEEGIHYFEKTWLSEEDFDLYFTEGKRLQHKYSSQISIGLGVEVGYNPACKKRLLQRLEKREWDIVGVSYHYFHHPDFHHALNLVSSKKENIINIDKAGCDELLTNYFENLIEAVQTLPGTMLCHLDAGLRHQKDLQFKDTHLHLIDLLIEEVQNKQMSIEVNTSGFKYRNMPYPAPFIIKKALALNIPLKASSDAHKPDDVARHFNTLEDYVAGCMNM